MRTSRVLVLAAVTLAAVAAGACGDGATSVVPSGGGLGGPSADEDERGSIGVPPSPAGYCTALGYTPRESDCQFPDGTRCELWSFFRAECGQPFSYCNRHGGTVSTRTEQTGGFTSVHAVCALGDRECPETDFYRTGTCE